MAGKVLFLGLAFLLILAKTISFTRHAAFSKTCLYLPAGKLLTQGTFNYTIIKAWNPEQAAQIENRALNASDFIRVEGWGPSQYQNNIYSIIKEETAGIQNKLTFVKNVLKASDVPEFGVADWGLKCAFDNPPKAIVAKVPQGKALLSFYCQPVSSSLQLSNWSHTIGLTDMNGLKASLKNTAHVFQRQIKKNRLTAREFVFTAHLQADVVENSLFYSFKTAPAEGTFGLIEYECYIYAIREGEQVLLGPISKEQQDVLQMIDLAKNRTSCE